MMQWVYFKRVLPINMTGSEEFVRAGECWVLKERQQTLLILANIRIRRNKKKEKCFFVPEQVI